MRVLPNPRQAPRTPVGTALEARAHALGFRDLESLGAAAGLSGRMLLDLVTGARESFQRATFVALDVALRLPLGITEEAISRRCPDLIARADVVPYDPREWLMRVMSAAGCTANPAALQKAASRAEALGARENDPGLRDLATAMMAVARAIGETAPVYPDQFEERLATRVSLTAGDREAIRRARAAARDAAAEVSAGEIPQATFSEA